MTFLQGPITIVLFLLILGGLVLAHELGHFAIARLARIRVHEFGIGFPPRAAVLRRGGETLYTVNWLPLGGFVKLEGEDGDSEDPRSFIRAPLLVRLVVLVAGVVMNVAVAFALMLLLAWVPQPAYGIAYRAVQPDSPAAAIGLGPNDLIVQFDGRRFDQLEPDAFLAALRGAAGRQVALGIIRGGAATDGTAAGVGGTIDIQQVTLRSPDRIDKDHGALGIEDLRWIASPLSVTRDPGTAVAIGWKRTSDAFSMIWSGLVGVGRSLITTPTQDPGASGPIGIAVTVGDVFWKAGLGATLYLAAILSANLALVNLLPFPPLDGGRMLMVVLRSLVGDRLSVRIERLTYAVGFVFLFAFLIWVTVFDIARLGGSMQ